ncbi:hypothetical protein GCM10027062_35760 [Nocardioides hungaricus]
MAQYFLAEEQTWIPFDVRGTVMGKRVLWEGGFDIRSALYRMPAGMLINEHRHEEWVQVMVVDGEMQVEPTGGEPVRVVAGGCYVLEPGDTHREKAVKDTLLLVTQLDEHPAYRATRAATTLAGEPGDLREQHHHGAALDDES